MQYSICTLFENKYHYGVAILSNSLFKRGFKGMIYAGYRGELPAWAAKAKPAPVGEWTNASKLIVGDGVELYFLPLETKTHFTNYKPDFMLQLLNGPAADDTGLFYLDPDIVLNGHWVDLENWINSGVAMSEDVNSPISKSHPVRIAWKRFYLERGIELTFKDNIYVNGGFVGVLKENKSFLETWQKIQFLMAERIGGLERSALSGAQLPQSEKGIFAPFSKTDQDALNIAIEAWPGQVSLVGKDAMGFGSGATIIPHALGILKPWNLNPVLNALQGKPPRVVDKVYWANASTPIQAHSSIIIQWKLIGIRIGSLIGRFYRRGNS